METAFDFHALSTGVFLILGAFALFGGGAVIVSRATRMQREQVGRRVTLVLSPLMGHAKAVVRDTQEADNALLRDLAETPSRREVIRRLTKIGIPAKRASLVFNGGRLLIALCLSLVGLMLGWHFTGGGAALPLVLLATIGGIVGWFIPGVLVGKFVKRRKKDVDAGLAEALELLVICAEAGLALGDGIDRVVAELKRSQPALSDELALTAADLKILPSRDQALANFAERVDLPGVRSLVTTLGQTMRYGTPLAQAMRVVSAELRDEALIHLEERANRLPALLTVPMMLFILPTIFLVVGGPAALKLMDAFAR